MKSLFFSLFALILTVRLSSGQDTPSMTPSTPAPESSPAATTTSNATPAHRTPPPPYVPVPTGTPATPPTDPAKFEIFLLVGQSNMAGRAPVTDEDKVADPHVLVLTSADQWVTEGEPIHFDKAAAGVGPGYTFAKLLAAKEPGVTIGVIPCAFGGTTLAQWDVKRGDKSLYKPYSLYENAVRRAQIAMKSGTLKGILWHQGESNMGKGAENYAATLAPIVASLRQDLNAPKVPFIAGEIGYYLYDIPPNIKDPRAQTNAEAKSAAAKTINAQIDSLATVIPDCTVVSAEGLVHKGDHLHFDNASQKQLGQRYLDAYLKLQDASTGTAPSKP